MEVTGSGTVDRTDSTVYRGLVQDLAVAPSLNQEDEIYNIHMQAVMQLKNTAIAASLGGTALIGLFGWIQGIFLLLSNTSNASSTRTYRRTVIEVGSMLLTSSGALTLSKVEGLVRRASTNSNAENDSCTVRDYCSHGNDGTNNSSANSPEMRNQKSEEASLLPSTASVRAIELIRECFPRVWMHKINQVQNPRATE